MKSDLFSTGRSKFSFNCFEDFGNENNALSFKPNQNIKISFYRLKSPKMHLRTSIFQTFLRGMPPNILSIFVGGWPHMESWLKAFLKLGNIIFNFKISAHNHHLLMKKKRWEKQSDLQMFNKKIAEWLLNGIITFMQTNVFEKRWYIDMQFDNLTFIDTTVISSLTTCFCWAMEDKHFTKSDQHNWQYFNIQ